MSWVDTLPCPASEELYVVFWSARSTSRVKFGQSWRKFSSQTREISCATPATQKRRRPNGTRGTPGRTSDPLPMHVVRPNDTRGTPEGRQGVHPTPLAKHVVPRLPRKSGGDQGAPAAETKWHRAYIPLAMHVVPRLPRKSGGDQGAPEGRQRDARAYIRPLGNEWVSECGVCVWVSEWVRVTECVCEWCVSEWVSERASERVSEWVCVSDVMWEWVSEWVWCVCEWCDVMWEWVSVVCLGEWVMLKWVSEWGSVRECEGGGTGRKERIQN